jgi:hypothetical protein
MDRNRFDNFARTLAEPATRRTTLAIAGRAITAALGLSAARHAFLPRGADAAACRAFAVSCSQDGQCCSGFCRPKDARGRRTCGCGTGEIACGGACLDEDALLSDPDNCGACGSVCTTDDPIGAPICQAGACGVLCPAGTVYHDGRCLLVDRQPCTASDQCRGGVCACRSTSCSEAICGTSLAVGAQFGICGNYLQIPVIDGGPALVCTDVLTELVFDCSTTPCASLVDVCFQSIACYSADIGWI